MIAGVADTHTALWYLLKNPRLSATARQFMEDAAISPRRVSGDGSAIFPWMGCSAAGSMNFCRALATTAVLCGAFPAGKSGEVTFAESPS